MTTYPCTVVCKMSIDILTCTGCGKVLVPNVITKKNHSTVNISTCLGDVEILNL